MMYSQLLHKYFCPDQIYCSSSTFHQFQLLQNCWNKCKAEVMWPCVLHYFRRLKGVFSSPATLQVCNHFYLVVILPSKLMFPPPWCKISAVVALPGNFRGSILRRSSTSTRHRAVLTNQSSLERTAWGTWSWALQHGLARTKPLRGEEAETKFPWSFLVDPLFSVQTNCQSHFTLLYFLPETSCWAQKKWCPRSSFDSSPRPPIRNRKVHCPVKL